MSFDWWHPVYNFERPHQALEMATPASRYAPSPRRFPETLPAIEYGDGGMGTQSGGGGWVHFKGHVRHVPLA